MNCGASRDKLGRILRLYELVRDPSGMYDLRVTLMVIIYARMLHPLVNAKFGFRYAQLLLFGPMVAMSISRTI